MRYDDAYRRALLEARVRFQDGIPPRVERRLLLEYAAMLVRITEEVSAKRISAERARELARSIEAEIRNTLRRFDLAFEKFRGDSMASAIDAHDLAIDAASKAAGIRPPEYSFAQVPADVVRLMVARRGVGYASTFRTLMNRRVERLAPEIDQFLASVVARGVSANRAAKELAVTLARDDAALLNALSYLGPRGGRTRKAIEEGVEIPDDLLIEAKKLLYDSRRITRTEINASYFEADRLATAKDPMVAAVKWTLSGRHSGLHSSPDVCFVAGTLVQTSFGSLPIEQVGPGDFVLTHAGRYRQVTRRYERTSRTGRLVRLRYRVGRSRIRQVDVTPNHPVLTDEGWVPAGDLRTGSQVFGLRGEIDGQPSRFDGGSAYRVESGFARSAPSGGPGTPSSAPHGERCRPIRHSFDTTGPWSPWPMQIWPSRNTGLGRTACRPSSSGSVFPSWIGRGVVAAVRAFPTFHGAVSRGLGWPRQRVGTCSPPPCIRPNSRSPLGFSAPRSESHSAHKRQPSSTSRPRFGRPRSRTRALEHVLRLARLALRRMRIETQMSALPSHTGTPPSRRHAAGTVTASCRCEGSFDHSSHRGGDQRLPASPELNTSDCRSGGVSSSCHRELRQASGPSEPRSVHSASSFGRAVVVDTSEVLIPSIRVYNLEVADDHTYVAGGLVVHNCDYYAQADLHGLGAGVYDPRTLPPQPHPHCLCGTQKILRPPGDWDKPKGPIARLTVPTEDDMGRFLRAARRGRDLGPKITDRYVRAQYEHLIGAQRAAEIMGAPIEGVLEPA